MTFARLLSEAIASDGLPRTGDVISVAMPLLQELADLHRQGRIATLESPRDIHYDGTGMHLIDATGAVPRVEWTRMKRLNPTDSASGVEVRSRHQLDTALGHAADWRSGDVHDSDEPAPRPMLLIGYRAWEQDHGHHDALTDTFVAGLFIVSFAAGLDLDNDRDVHTLANARRRLTALNPGLHPVVANVIAEMVDPDRHGRPPEITQVITRLEHHRELPDELDLSSAYADPSDWRHGVLSTLRNRVFDTTRRNRALYFRPSAATVSLTEASVPLLLDVSRITPDDLFTWTGSAADKLRRGATVDLEQWCRFEDSPHVAPALDKLISNERKLRTEHGHGRLRLIIAFLRWFDLQNDETVHSPLLLMPVELKRRKGVKQRYQIGVDGDAVVNPILRFVFKDRFGIELPETIDASVESITAFVGELERRVQATAPEIAIEIIEKPRIDLLRRRAQLRVDTYRRNRARSRAASGRWRRMSHSYSSDDWRPLGLALYERFAVSPELPLRALAGAPPRPRSRPHAFSDPPSGGGAASGGASSGGAASGGAASGGAERTAESYAASPAEVHRQRWEVDLCAVTLAMLGSRRTSLSKDYEDLLERVDAGDRFDGAPFTQLFAPEVSGARAAPVDPISIDQQLVLPADDAQARAVRRATRGDSFIIQGPPGTGKSQTITNVIAALVAEGKRVLFVCEKRAALDVVGHRLRQVGLGDLVATIHDSQLDRKSFVMDLGATYNAWLDAEPTDSQPSARQQALGDIQARLRPLDFLVRDLALPRLGSFSVGDLIERSVLMRARGIEPVDSAEPAVTLDDWFAARPKLDATRAALLASGLSPAVGAHAALRLRPDVAAVPDPITTAITLGRRLQQAVAELRTAWTGSSPVEAVRVADLLELRDFGSVIAAVGDGAARAALDTTAPQHSDLRRDADDHERAEQSVAASTVPSRWKQMMAADDARNGLAIAEANEGSFFKFLRSDWRSLRSAVESSYDFSRHTVPPPYTVLLAELVDHHDRVARFQAASQQSMQRYGVADPRLVRDLVDHHHANPVFIEAVRGSSTGFDLDGATRAVEAIADLSERLLVSDTATVESLAEIADGLVATSVAHESALVAWASAGNAAATPVLHWVVSSQADTGPLELRLVDDAAHSLLTETDSTMRSGAEIDALVADLLDRYRRLLTVNAQAVEATVQDRFLAHVAHSQASMAGRSDQDKAFKKAYNAGRRVLEREFTKKMRYRSIRELADGDTGLVVRDLRPIWLMSPLSVSDTLPLDDTMFDAVVFDEASQIPVEDAVPSTFRSGQVIVVGDRMQLPPTRFFSSASGDDDEIEVPGDDDDSVTISLDADSFLTQADQALSSTMLTWHYRSRHEALIAYSNAAFYEGSLATVPDRAHATERRAEIVVGSSEDAAHNVDELLARPISFHRTIEGVYANRSNIEEADYVAELVRALLERGTGMTIGIVAFSEAQQNVIETSLTELAALDPDFAGRLERERDRNEDGEFLGLFVKNLENVQGDERDIVILSVCYAPGDDGRMRMNFGPINQAGGERRLNVIFSRAKRHMAVVSTIEGHQITNTHNDGAAHLANFLHYAAAESVGDTARSDGILRAQAGGPAPGTERARSAVSQQIAERLRAAGHSADVSVGRSDFTIDVAVRRNGVYRLGILIDPAENEPTTSRFVAEAGVLDAFDWPILRVTPAEWWTAPDRVLERIGLRLDRAG